MKYEEAWGKRAAELGLVEERQFEQDPDYTGVDWPAEIARFDREFFGIYAGMQNKRMREKIVSGEALDLSKNRTNDAGDYLLDMFAREKDYCVAATEAWIWSIGRHKATGQILASTSSKFYQHPDYECLFLR